MAIAKITFLHQKRGQVTQLAYPICGTQYVVGQIGNWALVRSSLCASDGTLEGSRTDLYLFTVDVSQLGTSASLVSNRLVRVNT